MIINKNFVDFIEVVDQTTPASGLLRLYANTSGVLKVVLPNGEIRFLTPVNTYKNVAFGSHSFGTSPFSDLPSALSSIPIVQPVVIGDGDVMVSNLTVNGFTLSDRGIGAVTSVDILIFLV